MFPVVGLVHTTMPGTVSSINKYYRNERVNECTHLFREITHKGHLCTPSPTRFSVSGLGLEVLWHLAADPLPLRMAPHHAKLVSTGQSLLS